MPADRTTSAKPAESTSRWQKVFDARLDLLRIAAVVALGLVVAGLYRLAPLHHFFDLKIYVKAVRWWGDGNPLYDYVQPDRVQGQLYFTYPPFTALLLRPLAVLPIRVTSVIFTTSTIVATVVTTWWVVGRAAFLQTLGRRSVPRWFVAGLAVPLVFALESIRETITFGQINMLLVTLILADLLFAVPRGSRWAGVGVGLATALKLFPGIFLIYLLSAGRWRAAATAIATAAAATLLAAAVAPADSWRFWTEALWSTGRVGRVDYTGNQSLHGLLGRLSAPEAPNHLLWSALVVIVAGYGLWRAARSARAGDQLTGLALAGLVGALVSPITWPHHVYWFVPALVVLVDAGLRSAGPGAATRRRFVLLGTAAACYACLVYGVVSFHDWGFAPTDTPTEFVLRNLYVLLALLMLVALPGRRQESAVAEPAGEPVTGRGCWPVTGSADLRTEAVNAHGRCVP